MRSWRPGPRRTLRTPSWFASPPIPACARASSSRCAGATSSSSAASSSSRARCPPTSRPTPPRAAASARSPLPDQAAGALDRLSRREPYIGSDEYVFCNRFGRRLDPSALRRRYDRARDAAGLPPLRFHDLRHTYGSLLVAGGVDLISVKSAMGHSQIGTTERYLHARPATELAERFTTALGGVSVERAAPPRIVRR
jgi:hypothetical protein